MLFWLGIKKRGVLVWWGMLSLGKRPNNKPSVGVGQADNTSAIHQHPFSRLSNPAWHTCPASGQDNAE